MEVLPDDRSPSGRLEETRPPVKLRAYYLKVVNTGRQPAKNCRAYLILNGSGYARYIPGAPYFEVHVKTWLPWYSYGEHKTTLTLNPGEEAYVALIGVAGLLKPSKGEDLVVFPSEYSWDRATVFKSINKDATGTVVSESHAIGLRLFINLHSEFKISKATIMIMCENPKLKTSTLCYV